MVSINKESKDMKIISIENIISKVTSDKEKKELKKIFENFDNTELLNSYNLQNKLETIIKNYFKEQFGKELTKSAKQQRFEFNGHYLSFDSPDLIPKTLPNIEYVSQTFLNQLAGNYSLTTQVLGAYDPLTNTIYILNTLHGRQHDKVLYHEREHWLYPSASEEDVRRMTAMAGYF